EIVPLPWRGFEKITYAEDYNSGQDKRYVSWRSITPTPAGFPNTPADHPHEHHRQGNPQAEVWQPKLKKWRDDAVPRFLQKRTKGRRRSKIRSSTHAEKRSGKIRRILRPTRMPLEYRGCAKMIRNQPNKKTCWNQCKGQHRGGVTANRHTTENFRPLHGFQNQATDAGDSFVASQISEERKFTEALEKQPKDQDDRQGDKRVKIEQRH